MEGGERMEDVTSIHCKKTTISHNLRVILIGNLRVCEFNIVRIRLKIYPVCLNNVI